MKSAQAAAEKAIEEYKESEDFKDEVVEGCIESLPLGFLECKKKVATLFSGLDLKDIVESDDKGDEEEGEARAKVRTELIDTEEMVIGAVAKEIAVAKEKSSVEGVIIEAVIGTDAMVAEATEESGAIQTGAPDE